MSSPPLPPPGQPGPLQAGEFVSASSPTQVTFHLRDLSPPTNLYIRPEEFLQVSIFNSPKGPTTISVQARFLLTNGQVQVINLSFPTVATRGIRQPFAIPLTEGFLLSVQVFSAGNARGTAFVQASINRGTPGNSTGLWLLINDNLSTNGTLAWPGGSIRSDIEGPGFLNTVQQANPAAGADWTLTATAFTRWRIQSINAQLVTSATAGNRIPRVQLKDSLGNLVWQTATQAAIPASITAQISMGPGQVTSVADTTSFNIPLPGTMYTIGGDTIGTSTTGLLAGDQWSNIFARVEEWTQQT